MKKILISVLSLVALTFSAMGVSMAQEYEYNEYTVKSGDTLWDISGVELKDAFLWPMVWKENDHIKNPDLIFPGQTVRIPKSWLKQGEMTIDEVKQSKDSGMPNGDAQSSAAPKPDSKTITAQHIKLLAARELMLWSGYISAEIPSKGTIAGSSLGTSARRSIFSKDDEIYINTNNVAHAGQKFYVIRKEAKISHPVKWKTLGTLIRVIGTVQVDEEGTEGLKAHVVESFTDINTNDILDTYYEVEPPFITGEPRKPSISDAFIVATDKMHILNGLRDVVFIDKGERDGVKLGDIYMTLLPGTDDMRNSVIQVINVRNETSLAMINESRMDVGVGHIVTGLK